MGYVSQCRLNAPQSEGVSDGDRRPSLPNFASANLANRDERDVGRFLKRLHKPKSTWHLNW